MSLPSEIAAAGDGGACWACLLHHLSCYISSVKLYFAPSSYLYQHVSDLPLILDSLLAFPAQQQQHAQGQCETKAISFPTSFLLKMDALRLLILISDDVRVLLSALVEGYSDGTQDCIREEIGLLDGNVQDIRSEGCVKLLFPFLCKRMRCTQKESAVKDMQMTERYDVGKRLIKAVNDLRKYSHVLQSSLENLSLRLSSTAELISNTLAVGSSPQHYVARCATTASLRTCIGSFLYAAPDGSPSDSQHAYPASLYGEELLVKKAEVIIENLLNPQGPSFLGIGGCSGVGKSCLATQVASDGRIAANFPGGVFFLSVGYEPDLTSLQAFLWQQMWGGSICHLASSKPTFSSPEEGTAALMNRVQEWLPCLVVLDDVWYADHVRPFMCFNAKDHGRILVVSQVVESILTELQEDVFVHNLDPLDEEEESFLFNSISSVQVSKEPLTFAGRGVPRLIEAAASILYYEKERVFSSPFIHRYLKQGLIVNPDAMLSAKEMRIAGEQEKQVNQQDFSVTSSLEAKIGNLLVFFDALAEVHPGLQECFLDLAAFPKGTWVSSSTLVDIWNVGDGMEKERVVFVLGFLASRSLIEWKVEKQSDGELEGGLLVQWRLAGEFYELAQALNKMKMETTPDYYAFINRGKKNVLCGVEHGVDAEIQDANCILKPLLSALEMLNIFAGLQVHPNAESGSNLVSCYVQEHSNLRLENLNSKMNIASRRGPRLPRHTLHQEKFRLFMPGSEQSSSTWWRREFFLNKATKLSLISGSLEEFPRENFLNLRIAFLSSNWRLRSIPASALKCMEKLVVLDLKQCISLTSLPESICTLQYLELLELSSCTHLTSLPQSIGKLRNLKFLRLSGCMSLTGLPMSLGSLSNLTLLDLSRCAGLKRLPKTVGKLSSLQILNLSGCHSLYSLPANMALLRNLSTLVVSGCRNLSYSAPMLEQIKILAGWTTGSSMAIPLNLWKLGKIEVLHLCSLKNLTYVPESVRNLQHLRCLNLSGCRCLEYLPDELGSLFLLEKLDLSHTAIRKLPTSFGQLSSLVILCLRGCSRLLCIPPSVCVLPKLEYLEMAECWDFVMLPVEFGCAHALPKLISLDLSGCSFKQLPHFSKGALPMLRDLHLSGCQNLVSLPNTLGILTSLEKINIDGCRSLESLQGIGLATLKQLRWLNVRNCISLTSLPVLEMESLQSLKVFDVSGCTKLNPFPDPLLQCAREDRFTLIRWGTVWH